MSANEVNRAAYLGMCRRNAALGSARFRIRRDQKAVCRRCGQQLPTEPDLDTAAALLVDHEERCQP